MPCYHPLKAYYRINESTGKKKLAFVDCNDLPFYEKDGERYSMKIEIPCGQCIGCRLEYSRQWALRCVLEAQQWSNNYFLTLTYDDEHLPPPMPDVIDEETGEVFSYFPHSPLAPSDLRLFLKNFRRQLEYHYDHKNLRVYYCGEYGSLSGRPHYHVILFNCPVLPLQFWKYNQDHRPMYNCEFIDKIWKNGYSVIAEVNWNTCAYVARYMLKKHKGKDSKQYYDDRGLVPEFTGMSRRPGIARDFYERNKHTIYKTDEVFCIGSQGKAQVLRPPRYFDRLYDVDDPDSLEELKTRRLRKAVAAEKMQDKTTSLSKKQYLLLREENQKYRIKGLTRIL